MNDEKINNMNKRKGSDKLDLAEQISELDWDIQPSKDLWPDISSTIRFADKHRRKKSLWVPMAVAASMVLAIGALMFSWMSFQMASDNRHQQALMVTYQQAQLDLIEQQHKMVRVQFVQLLKDKRNLLNPDFVSEAQTLMLNIDQASLEIKKAMSVQPNSPNYTSMLVGTYQQEIKLLNQIKARPVADNNGTSI